MSGVAPGIQTLEVLGYGSELRADDFVVLFVGFYDVLGEGLGESFAKVQSELVFAWSFKGFEAMIPGGDCLAYIREA